MTTELCLRTKNGIINVDDEVNIVGLDGKVSSGVVVRVGFNTITIKRKTKNYVVSISNIKEITKWLK